MSDEKPCDSPPESPDPDDVAPELEPEDDDDDPEPADPRDVDLVMWPHA